MVYGDTRRMPNSRSNYAFSPPTLLLPFYMVHNFSLFNSWKGKRRKVSLVLFLTLLPSRLSRLPQEREKEKEKRYKEGKQQKGQVKTFCLRPGGMKPLACRHSSHFRWNQKHERIRHSSLCRGRGNEIDGSLTFTGFLLLVVFFVLFLFCTQPPDVSQYKWETATRCIISINAGKGIGNE